MKGLSNSLENEIVDKDLPKDKITLPPCQLISNPFIKVAKKKKKKKKK